VVAGLTKQKPGQNGSGWTHWEGNINIYSLWIWISMLAPPPFLSSTHMPLSMDLILHGQDSLLEQN